MVQFFNEVFLHAQADKIDEYIGEQYIQHNPNVPDGKGPLRGLLTHLAPMVKREGKMGEIVRAVAENDLVVLHVKFFAWPTENGSAVVETFRVKNGKIVEHWDVLQAIPTEFKNANGMF